MATLAAILLAACGADNKSSAEDPATLAALDKQLAGLESGTKQFADEAAILENELRYTRGLDRHDASLARAAFWDDAVINYGNVVPVDTIGTWANSVHMKRAAHQHHVTGLNLDIAGETAHEEGYILFTSDIERDTHFDTSGTPSPGRVKKDSKATLGTGRYINRYAYRDGQWKMVVHEYVHDLSIGLTPVDLCATACMGRWDPTDLSYQRPLHPLAESEYRERRARGKKPTAQLAP
jgi:hypothetical protein